MGKRAGDAWDIYRLLVELDADGAIGEALADAPAGLRSLARNTADRVLVTDAVRTRGWLRAGDTAMATVTVDELRFVGRRLVETLS